MERSCGPMNKNRIEGAADQGERAINREALVTTKGKRRRSILEGHLPLVGTSIEVITCRTGGDHSRPVATGRDRAR